MAFGVTIDSVDAVALLWTRIGHLFDSADDGSLPEVQFKDVTARGGELIFRALLARAAPLADAWTAWTAEDEVEAPSRDLGGSVAQVFAGRLSHIYVDLTQVVFDRVEIPRELGVGVYAGEISVDYQMGEGWDATVLSAFVRLIGELRDLDPGCRIVYWDAAPEETRQLFAVAVEEYLVHVRAKGDPALLVPPPAATFITSR